MFHHAGGGKSLQEHLPESITGRSNGEKETYTVQLTDPMLYGKLRTLSAEYDLSVESLANAAVKRLVDDIDFVRSLRTETAGERNRV